MTPTTTAERSEPASTGAERTAAARAASMVKRRRNRQNRLADDLTTNGWLTVPPEKAEEVRAALAAAGVNI